MSFSLDYPVTHLRAPFRCWNHKSNVHSHPAFKIQPHPFPSLSTNKSRTFPVYTHTHTHKHTHTHTPHYQQFPKCEPLGCLSFQRFCEVKTILVILWWKLAQNLLPSFLLSLQTYSGVFQSLPDVWCHDGWNSEADIEALIKVDCVDHNKLWKILKEMRKPDHLTCLLRNLRSHYK